MSARAPEQLATAAASRSIPEREFLIECLSDCYRPREVPGIEEWLINKGIRITADANTTYQGEIYDPRRCPVVARLVFKFFETPGVYELFGLKPVQSMFTTLVFFAAMHMFIFRPRTGIMAMHTRQEMRKKKKDTFKPVVDQIPELSAHLDSGTGKNRDESTAEEFRFRESNLYAGGGQSNAVLTSTAAGLVILDECEQHGTVDGTSTISLARGRITGGDEWRKIIGFSKPRKEARFDKDENTGALTYIPEEGTYLHAEYLSGNQLRYECPCPDCGVFTEPHFRHLVFSHCNAALPGQPPDYDRELIMREVYWQCPHCVPVTDEDKALHPRRGRVHEGEEKRRWVLAGRWIETPLEERKRKDKYPRPEPGRWSFRFTALTDIAFDSLHWGNIVRRFLDAQGDPGKLTAFNNEIMAEPEPLVKVSDTTLDHLKRLIPNGTRHPVYRLRDSHGLPVRTVPCLQKQLHYIGMAVDSQLHTLKWSVRAHYHDGTAPLLDRGTFNRTSDFRELTAYIDTQRWECEDGGPARGIYRCYVDVGGEGSNFYDVLDLSVAHPRVQGIKGEGERAGLTDKGVVWKAVGYTKSLPVEYWTVAAGYWERRLYEECIQKFPDPYRHRVWAPALLLPEDIDDDYLREFTHVRLVLDKGKPRWVKVPLTAKNDWADCDRMHLVMDYNLRLKFLLRAGLPGAQPAPADGEEDGPASDDTATAPPVTYKLKPRPRMA